ncbi:tyrosine-type recombinase/integrase [Lachnoclostridium sp. Marseille-P6806]|uniref:tyrosine-type recombinase/integrase n=1 Tax=Lachnoclostridium sp. Marseille-P6806 TaxID=2364793 RepID=UPI0013EF0861|nr:site-specific integrase [Lachnoclostridium sp. Marseille-P6806]
MDMYFSEIMDRWLLFIQTRVSGSTYYEYHSVVMRYFYRAMGPLPLSELDEAALIRALDALAKEHGEPGLSPSTLGHIVTILRQILHFMKEENIADIPLHYRVHGAHRSRGRCFEARHVASIVAFCEASGRAREYGVVLSLYLGLRIGELCALQWSDISLCRGSLYVCKTVKRVPADADCRRARCVIGPPKTESSYREVPLPDFIWAQLRILHETVRSDAAYFLNGRTDRFVFPRSYEQSFKTWLVKCGIPDINVHSMRHSFATNCLMTGCDLKTLSELLGHSNPTVTLNMYVHSSMEEKRQAVNRLRKHKTSAEESKRQAHPAGINARNRRNTGKNKNRAVRKTDSFPYISFSDASVRRRLSRLSLYYMRFGAR